MGTPSLSIGKRRPVAISPIYIFNPATTWSPQRKIKVPCFVPCELECSSSTVTSSSARKILRRRASQACSYQAFVAHVIEMSWGDSNGPILGSDRVQDKGEFV